MMEEDTSKMEKFITNFTSNHIVFYEYRQHFKYIQDFRILTLKNGDSRPKNDCGESLENGESAEKNASLSRFILSLISRNRLSILGKPWGLFELPGPDDMIIS